MADTSKKKKVASKVIEQEAAVRLFQHGLTVGYKKGLQERAKPTAPAADPVLTFLRSH